jgi:hypothetical protein
MGDGQGNQNKPEDPMNAFRDMRDSYLDAWAKAMVETVNTEVYAKTSGQMLDSYLSASSPFREAVEKTMLRVLEQLSMPSRADFIALAERTTNIEMRLDDMDAKLDRIEQLLTPPRSAQPGKKRGEKPTRSRRPAAPSRKNTNQSKGAK